MLSMTGFANKVLSTERYNISIDIRSLNHRFLDINLKYPNYLNSYEKAIRDEISKHLKRGKVDIFFQIQELNQDFDIMVNLPLAEKYFQSYRKLKDHLSIDEDIRLWNLASSSGVMAISEDKDTTELWKILEGLLKQLIENLMKAKAEEGKTIKVSLNEILNAMEGLHGKITAISGDIAKEYEAKLRKKFNDLMIADIDETRLITEIGLLVSKSDINEELERLKAHIDKTRELIESEPYCGRQLDFFSQEMNREINTIGSKVNSINISNWIIELKTLLEQFKEQIRNVE